MTTAELLLHCWRADPLALCVAAVAAAGHVKMRRNGPSGSPLLRDLCFAIAALVLILALASPIGQLADGYLFSAHMLQHLLLVLVVPPLALLGLHLRGGEGAARPAEALAGWGLGVGAMWLWHEPTLCNAASTSPLVHRLQEASLLVMGAAFWLPVIAGRLRPLAGIVYLFTACVACTVLGVLLTFSPPTVCSVFLHPVDRLGVMPLLRTGWGLTPDKDQQIGGLMMWVPACLVYAAGIMGQLARLYAAEGAALPLALQAPSLEEGRAP
jgi:cytochrome c oxidase assembly factor CtaG